MHTMRVVWSRVVTWNAFRTFSLGWSVGVEEQNNNRSTPHVVLRKVTGCGPFVYNHYLIGHNAVVSITSIKSHKALVEGDSKRIRKR